VFIPIKDSYVEMTPTNFEKYSIKVLEDNMGALQNIHFEHNKKIKAKDGTYQIDGFIEFDVMGIRYKTLVECKLYKNPVSREIIQKVFDNLRAVGAQKGIVISTSNFQSGAIQYAEEHGIALIQITNAGEEYCTRGYNVIMNYPHVPSNSGNPYIGVQIGCLKDGNGVTCAYLTHHSDALYDFLIK
jgi:restriction system protein